MTAPSPHRILLILDGPIGPGDALRSSFCLDAVRYRYPEAEIVLLVAKAAAPIIRNRTLFDRVVVSELYSVRSDSLQGLRLMKARELARIIRHIGMGYDLVITLLWGSTLLNLLGRMAGRRQIGFANKLPWLLSSRLGRYDFSYDANLIEQQLVLLAAAGVESPAPAPPAAIHDPADLAAIHNLLDEHGIDAANALVVLHPGSDWACQQWLPDRWAALADRLVADYGAEVVFTGVASEQRYIDGIRALMRSPSVSLAGETTLPQLGALLARSRLCVCVDSAAYELAQAAGLPTIVLAGQSDPLQTIPGHHPPIMINHADRGLKLAISRCKAAKDMHGGCLNYECPMAGLRDIDVTSVLNAVEQLGALHSSPELVLRRA